MLNCNKVLQYIKTNLGFPHVIIELTDSEIIEHFTTYTLREFSKYFPHCISIGFDLQANKVPGYQNKFYIYDPDGLEILNVKDLILNNKDIFFGHPIMGVFSYSELPSFMLDVEMARTARKWSIWNYNFFFIHPNIIEIRPVPDSENVAIVEIERMQPPDLSGISNELQHYFEQLAFADICIRIGRIRKMYGGNLRTPFGEISLSSEIFEEGKELRREMIELLSRGSLPNVTISFG